jgi:glycerate kinase
LGAEFATIPGAGAAGGLGFGFAAFLGARIVPGFELFARQTQLQRRLCEADLVITGEGALDRSTLMGKGVGEIGRRSNRQGIPCLAVGGRVSSQRRFRSLFAEIHALDELTDLADAKARAAFWLERLAAQLSRRWRHADFSQ